MISSTTKNTQLVCLHFVLKPKKKSSGTDIMNDDQKAYAFAPTYGDGSTDFHRRIISVVVFSYSNKLQIMLVNYAVTYMDGFDDYSDASPRAKKMRGNGITTFLLYVDQCITFNDLFCYRNTY